MPETKNWFEVFLMPVVIASVGIVGTMVVTAQQEQNAIILAEADRQVKVLEIFADKIVSTEPKQRILALGLLRAVDGELAQKLTEAVRDVEQEKTVRESVDSAAADANRRIPFERPFEPLRSKKSPR